MKAKVNLTYALNAEGKLVHVDDVPNGNKCGCICPACNEPLQARKGNKREHHFAHQGGSDCPHAVETTLHLLAKEKIQKAFYEQEEFNIEYDYHSYCPNIKTCQYERCSKCESVERRKYNIKKFYDTCEQEIPYNNIDRRSDLKIWSIAHPDREPIYIEIFVTHQSDKEKLHSGNKIIEVKIENENDIDNIVRNGFSESKAIESYEDDHKTDAEVSFYGFKNKDYSNNGINQEIVFSRYILYKSGKFQCYQDRCLCKELKRERPDALYEICFHTCVALGIHELAKWMGYRRFGIKNCLLCRNYVDSYNDTGKLCRLYKYLGINRFEKHDAARAKTCGSFVLNEEEMNESLNVDKWVEPVAFTEL